MQDNQTPTQHNQLQISRRTEGPARPFHESLQFALLPEGEGDLDETSKRRLAVLIWDLAAVSESDEYLQTMRAVILERFPTLYLWALDDKRAGLPPRQDSPEERYLKNPDNNVLGEFLPFLVEP
jgi:hypothetical protein